jgi:hypothetical protein
MRGLTDYITQAGWSDILTVQYVLVDDCYQQLDASILPERKFAPQGVPDFSDSEVITIALFGEMVFAGDEDKTLHFIGQYHLDLFPDLLDNSRFNRRRHQLVAVMEAIREKLRDRWRREHPLDEEEENLRIVDSAPISICTYTRGGRCQSIPLEWRDEWFGVCSSKKTKFFGARCHITTTLDQMIDTWLLAPGSYDDRKPMAALLENRQGLGIIGDKGYVSEDLANRLWEDDQHLLLTLKKDNQKEQWPGGIQRILGYLRHRVETTFSVLQTVFNFERPKSRSLAGLMARTTTKILAHTISFFLAEILTPELSN